MISLGTRTENGPLMISSRSADNLVVEKQRLARKIMELVETLLINQISPRFQQFCYAFAIMSENLFLQSDALARERVPRHQERIMMLKLCVYVFGI